MRETRPAETQSDYEVFEKQSEENRKLLREERFLLQATEELVTALQSVNLRKSDLARKLGKSKGFVTQILSGGRNLTLRSVADVADALGYEPHLKLRKRVRGRVTKNVSPFRWSRIGDVFRNLEMPRSELPKEEKPTVAA